MFSIELGSKGDVKNVRLENDEKVLIEGSIGSFIQARFLEDLVLEVIGSNGELRLDLNMNDLQVHPGDEGTKADRGSEK